MAALIIAAFADTSSGVWPPGITLTTAG